MKAKYQTPVVKKKQIAAPTLMAGSNWEAGAKRAHQNFDEAMFDDEDGFDENM